MEPTALRIESFKGYGPLARDLATRHLELLRGLPLPLPAVLLRDVIDLDTRFPVERATIEARFSYLEALPPDERSRLTKGFAELSLSRELIGEDWVSDPQKFEEDLSAYLWASKQHDAFHRVATDLSEAMNQASVEAKPSIPRWTVVALGQELRSDGYPLFKKLRSFGVFYPKVETVDGMAAVFKELNRRAATSASAYGHWYIDGGTPNTDIHEGVSQVSWRGSTDLREAVLQKAADVVGSGKGGPEMLRSMMASWALESSKGAVGDPLIDRFVMSLYGDGSGTQIFSTTFAQWAAREILRRARPLSLVVRYAPRQKQRTLNELFSHRASGDAPDFAGSLVDADFGAYYTWINQSRLPSAQESSFIAWSEAHRQALVIGPGCPRGTEAPNATPLEQLLRS